MIRKTLFSATLAIPALAAPALAEVVTKSTDRTVCDAMNALKTAVTDAGATVFARVDHATGAASVDMELIPMELLIFGNPQLVTPALQADPLTGLYLPLKVLVYEQDGQTLDCLRGGRGHVRRLEYLGRRGIRRENDGHA
jgi:uncharacterized protein (DUF302 family)